MLEWGESFPPLNLHNFPTKPMITERDIEDWKMMGMHTQTKKPTDPSKQGLKYDADKPRMELLDADALLGLARVLTFGANKYAADNWRNGIEYTRIIGALMRHLAAIQRGEDIDPESGLPHIDHLGCEWMFLSNFMKTRPDLDNRWKGRKE